MQKQEDTVAAVETEEDLTLTDQFHRLNNLIPADQRVETVRPGAPVAEAISLLERKNFSQVPVVEGNQVLGVFSFRSFAVRVAQMTNIEDNLLDLPVDEFIEESRFFHVDQDVRGILAPIDEGGSVLVGQPNRLQGIVTPVDVMNYLYAVASPFVLLQEIELSLRKLIAFSVEPEELRECIERSLEQHYGVEDLPTQLDELTFNDYIQIIGDGRNWPKFSVSFGNKEDFYRKRTRAKLVEVREIRNDVFHFKDDVTISEYKYTILSDFRDWLLVKTRTIEAQQGRGRL